MVTIDAKEFECFEPAKLDGEIGRLGPYRISGLIGKGGMGFVVVAEDTRLQRDVALKVMNQKYLNTPGSRHRFLEEARAMARVNHDNVVTIYEVGQFNETPFMAMELLHGQSVEHLNECVQEES
ncbi:MAG: protein kinase, partial [Planctomycetota bacterium]